MLEPSAYPKGANCKPRGERPPGCDWVLRVDDFFEPHVGGRITDRYGVRLMNGREEWHNGLDLAPGRKASAGFGALVLAPCDGVISRIRVGGSKDGVGDRVAFWPFGKNTPWMNLLHVCASDAVRERFNIAIGTEPLDHAVQYNVKKGEVIGFCNETGRVSGAHIHLQARIGGFWYDPEGWVML